MAGLLAGGWMLAPHTPSVAEAPIAQEDVSLAASIVFIDGHDYPYGSTRMANEITGQSQYQPCTTPCTHLTAPAPGTAFIFINTPQQYPGTLGLLDGPTATTGDQSVALGQQSIEQQLSTTPPSATNPVTVVGYSQGAIAASHEVSNWAPTNNIGFVLIADPERPNGGILARFPAGTYIPLIGITAGHATSASGAPVVMVTQQYDGVADAPVYVGNVLADMNAFLGAYYLHGNYYPVNPNAAGNIVTTSANGNMTDILVPAAPGALPIFIPLAQAGVPQAILIALDPAVRAIIETGYNRTTDPSQQVMFALLPPASVWPADAQAIAAGFALTAQELPGALAASFPGLPGLPLPATTSPTPSAVLLASPLASSWVPLGTTQVNSPVPVTTPNTSAVPQTQLISQLQPAPQVQQAITNQTNNAGTDVVQHSTSTPTTLSTNGSPPAPRLSQTVSAPSKTATTVNDPSGKLAIPTGNGPNMSPTGSTQPHGAATDATHGASSVIGTSTSSGSSSHK
jgi:hypothetical protein